MTREPDRFDVIADRIVARGLDAGELADDIAAAIRAEHEEMLERAAYLADSYGSYGCGRAIRALASPAAMPAAETCPEPPPGLVETLEKVHGMGCGNIATQRIPAPPAAEVKVNACQVDLRTDKDRECFDDIVQAATRVLRSGPVTPAPLLPRILAALDIPSVLGNRERLALAAELRAYIAKREPAEKRIAELETALRDALSAAHHHVQAGQHWICSEPFACEEECPCAKLAARAAKAKGEGT